jgi:hypothetical protein
MIVVTNLLLLTLVGLMMKLLRRKRNRLLPLHCC